MFFWEKHSFIIITALANIALGHVSEEVKLFYRNNAGGTIKKEKKLCVGYNGCDAAENLSTGGRHLHQLVGGCAGSL